MSSSWVIAIRPQCRPPPRNDRHGALPLAEPYAVLVVGLGGFNRACHNSDFVTNARPPAEPKQAPLKPRGFAPAVFVKVVEASGSYAAGSAGSGGLIQAAPGR